MNPAYVTAVAALAGSAVGGLTSLAASWLTQRAQARAQQLAHDVGRREVLYKNFIEEASKSYADAIQHNEIDGAKLVRLYAVVSRMRVLSSQPVVERADTVMRMIMETYAAPNKTIRDVADTVNRGGLDPLRDFSSACREELRTAVGGTTTRESLKDIPSPVRCADIRRTSRTSRRRHRQSLHLGALPLHEVAL